MKKWTTWAAIALLLACGSSCSVLQSSAKRSGGVKDFSYRTAAPMDAPPQRLIGNFSPMATHDQVAWLWMRPDVSLDQLRGAALISLENFTPVDFPWAENQLRDALQELFPGPAHGPGAVAAKAAIVEMLPRTKLLSRLSPGFDELPYIEVELVFFETAGDRILGALIHYAKDKDFTIALSRLIRDVRVFFNHPSPGTPAQ